MLVMRYKILEEIALAELESETDKMQCCYLPCQNARKEGMLYCQAHHKRLELNSHYWAVVKGRRFSFTNFYRCMIIIALDEEHDEAKKYYQLRLEQELNK